ncbi:PEP-CTERM sorting domain-containing protein [Pacificimonas sp. ICDLI1SI03]
MMTKAIILTALLSTAVVTGANATVVSYTLDQTVEGDAPSGAPTLLFDDGDTPGSVQLTVDAMGLSGGEFITGLFFNFAAAGTNLTFTYVSGSAPMPATIYQSADGRNSPGNQGLFDIEFEFSTSNKNSGALRFNADEILVLNITGANLVATDFLLDSAPEGPNAGSNYALARIQGISGGLSASVAPEDPTDIPPPLEQVPEPAALGLFGLGLLGLGLGASRRRRSKRTASHR